MTYHLLLADMIGLIPYTLPTAERKQDTNEYYKIRTKVLHVINRSGTFEKESADLILPLHPRMVQSLIESESFTRI
jgi:hypothetical protein